MNSGLNDVLLNAINLRMSEIVSAYNGRLE
jgi:hypothetical protein